ncbi:hypothetical protein [Desulfobacula sp.]|uniref:hypothetical protein n=1 Tax=Desulfobacula sp. TaxID=2593537 RepID=UPI002639F19A|nr:hypothetical protein [Desulfobacula sp.]
MTKPKKVMRSIKRRGIKVRNKTAIQFIPRNSRTPARIPVLLCPMIRPKKKMAQRITPVAINIFRGMYRSTNGTEDALQKT